MNEFSNHIDHTIGYQQQLPVLTERKKEQRNIGSLLIKLILNFNYEKKQACDFVRNFPLKEIIMWTKDNGVEISCRLETTSYWRQLKEK